MAQKELEAHKLEADATVKTAKADYEDMHHTMTELVEAEQKKATDIQEKLEEAEKAVSAKEKLLEELEAQLKVKDAEIAEAKVSYLKRTRTTDGFRRLTLVCEGQRRRGAQGEPVCG
jgi:chromosome segregation ATPase